MIRTDKLILVSHDPGLLEHWKKALGSSKALCLSQFSALSGSELPVGATVWIDGDLPGLPAWKEPIWASLLRTSHIVCTSSMPKNVAAIQALDAGCSAFVHAFADFKTLKQVQQVVVSGQIWVGRDLMQQLLAGANKAGAMITEMDRGWDVTLTSREKEIAVLAANGASNKAIAANCSITERTVKAHLAAIFEKLNLTDRLQLALRVHGIN
ncbi:MAG: response regulator transcription factor [Rhodoferax sp.]|nr:response regulator transcription factor [Rhodoferax sp.]MBK7548129.1 response regulator transcription factor [Rhodoferax sp.]